MGPITNRHVNRRTKQLRRAKHRGHSRPAGRPAHGRGGNGTAGSIAPERGAARHGPQGRTGEKAAGGAVSPAEIGLAPRSSPLLSLLPPRRSGVAMGAAPAALAGGKWRAALGGSGGHGGRGVQAGRALPRGAAAAGQC